MKNWEITVDENNSGLRLDKCLAQSDSSTSRSHFTYLIKEGKVTINGNVVTVAKEKVSEGDIIEAGDTHKVIDEIPHCEIELNIIFEDDHLIVIDKQYDLVVHPVGKTLDSVIGALLNGGKKLSSIDPSRPGVVHRIDKTTSGLLIIAKTNEAHERLSNKFRNREIYKEYLALVHGRLSTIRGEIVAPLKRIPGTYQMKTSEAPDAKEAITEFETMHSKGDNHLMRIVIKTGRMHQIRVHMQYIECPVIGDVKYDGIPAKRIMLHAHKLKFKHPITGEDLQFESPRPREFNKYIN